MAQAASAELSSDMLLIEHLPLKTNAGIAEWITNRPGCRH